MLRKIDTAFWIGDVVYLRSRDDAMRGIVCGLQAFGSASVPCISYQLCWGNGTNTWHYDLELSTQYIPDWSQADEGGLTQRGQDHA